MLQKIKFILKVTKIELLSYALGICSLIWGVVLRNKNKLDYYPNKKGCLAIVTGGERGLGASVVKRLVKSGMHVIVGAREPETCNALIEEIEDSNFSGKVQFLKLDTSSLESVKTFADQVSSKHSEVHLLVNNAGIIYQPFSLTDDGFESHLATNYLGHFYLTHLLLKNLEQGTRTTGVCSRIVSVSSCAHSFSTINFDDINIKEQFFQLLAYSQSKLAVLMSSRYINRYLENRNIPVRSYACNPGVVNTAMLDKLRNNPLFNWVILLSKSPEEGATTVLYPCLSEKLEGRGGHYISDCRDGYSSAYSQDVLKQEKLFDLTCKLLKIRIFGELYRNHNKTNSHYF